MANIRELLGKTLASVTRPKDVEELHFVTADGQAYRMWHSQDCCESVSIEDIDGDLNDLVGSTITLAEESTSRDGPKKEWDDSFTWTFYRLATVKGYVTIRWYGGSNGYYSESVDFDLVR